MIFFGVLDEGQEEETEEEEKTQSKPKPKLKGWTMKVDDYIEDLWKHPEKYHHPIIWYVIV